MNADFTPSSEYAHISTGENGRISSGEPQYDKIMVAGRKAYQSDAVYPSQELTPPQTCHAAAASVADLAAAAPVADLAAAANGVLASSPTTCVAAAQNDADTFLVSSFHLALGLATCPSGHYTPPQGQAQEHRHEKDRLPIIMHTHQQ